jgi:hypothetical protein
MTVLPSFVGALIGFYGTTRFKLQFLWVMQEVLTIGESAVLAIAVEKNVNTPIMVEFSSENFSGGASSKLF